MNKQAQAVARAPLTETDHKNRSNADALQLKQQKEESIRTQLAEFAHEMEQLKQLHITH